MCKRGWNKMKDLDKIKKHVHDLGERVKELNCLYGIAESIRTKDTIAAILQDTANIIPPAWHYPEITRGKVRFDGKEYVSEAFEESKWNQSADIIVNGKVRGSIEVYYLEECPELDEGPFMKEERNLINSMVKTISEAIERNIAEEKLKSTNQQLLASEQQQKAANQQLMASDQQLKAANQQLMASDQQLRAANQQLEATNQQLRASEQTIRKSERELTIRNKIAEIFLTLSDEQMYDEVLKTVIEAMESKYGVFRYIDEEGAFVAPPMSRHIWDQCHVADKNKVFHRKVWGESTWPRAIRERRTIYSNQSSTKIPEGHIGLTRHISMPIIHRGEVVGLIQVANKKTDYNERDIALFETIGKTIAPILDARLQRDREERERKRAEDELRQYAHIVSSTSDMLALLDNRFIYLAANKAYLEAFKLTADQLIGHTVAEVFGEEFLEKFIKPNAERCLTGQEVNYQTWIDFPAYRPRYMDITYYPYRGVDKKIIGYVVNTRNITERKQAEDQLKNQNVLLEKAVQEKQKEMESLMARLIRQEKLATVGQISGSIAHELRNPLSVIRQSIFFLNHLREKNEMESSASKVKEHFELVMGEIEVSNKVISDLLQMTRMEPLKKKQVDFQSIIAEVLDRYPIEKHAKLKIDLKPEPLLIWADPLQMRQVLINLLSNATHEIINKRVVTIRAEMLKKNKKCFINIHDDGPGIAKKNLSKVFEPLYTTKVKGIGLGLNICKQIIESHGGSISLTSEIGKGTTVKIELPYET